MSFSGNFMTTSFKQEAMQALHNFSASGGNTFNMALYTNAGAAFDASTTVYTASNEVTGTGYTARGQALTNVDPTTSGTTAFTDFADETWSGASFTTRGCLIFNVTNGDRVTSVHDFGSDRTVSSGDFTVQFPTPDATNAVLRIA